VAGAIQQAMDYDGPFLIDFMVEPEENVFPMVPPGASNAEFVEGPRKEVSTWPLRSTP
jgi:acetolactate synthase-1/2/3 large subunit